MSIYYVSAEEQEIRKIMDYEDMSYYGGNKNKRYLHAVTLKNAKEFYVLYTTSIDREASKEYLVGYRARK